MERLRIGVIGLGWFGEIHCETIVGVPNLELAALCTRTPERLAALAGEVRRVQDLHATITTCWPIPRSTPSRSCTMWDQHTEPAVAALEAGKHVFLEKPMASTVADCQHDPRRVDAGARASSQVGHICRFNPRYRMAKQAIAAGRRSARSSRSSSRRNIPAAWTPEILNKIGPIVGDAIHDTDLMLWFTGDRVVSAYAQTVDVRGLKHPDIGQTMYRFAGGATATLETVWCMPEQTPFDIDERMSIIGTDGYHPRPGHVPEPRHRLAGQVPQPGHHLLAGVRRRARWCAARGIRLLRELRADRHAARDRAARGRDGGARGDARRRGVGAHRRGRAAGSLDPGLETAAPHADAAGARSRQR